MDMPFRKPNPLEEALRLHQEMDRFFASQWGFDWPMDIQSLPLKSESNGVNALRRPVSELWEDDKTVFASFELPGLEKKDIAIKAVEQGLEIVAEKKAELESKQDDVVFRKKSHAGFYQFVPLPKTVEADKAVAEYRNGILQLSIPKKPDLPKPHKQIEVK